ncbi:MAG: MFS transporter [Firmicutes bacterium HGW-Firmicutes-1]|jgi:fucose permease|nr:MAG: MFS transporter [Firmicutes bacterium HGW-Firmicutes-1]
MATFFLLIIYLVFISLGLPDSLLGSAWSVMRLDLNVPLGWAGIISMTISGGTILSSLMSERMIKRFGTGKVTFFSVSATALALLGFSFAPSFLWLIVCAIPLGLGAGSVDAGINNYVAMHYKPHHMSWLHCFWGIGATLGPIIMAQNILKSNNWSGGYFTIAIIQLSLIVILFFTLPLWNKIPNRENIDKTAYIDTPEQNTKVSVLSIKGVKLSLIAFLFYCGTELTVGLWGSSYLVLAKGMAPVTAARWISMYYAGITVGRLITGFLTLRVSCRRLIQGGQVIALSGVLLLLLPFAVDLSLIGLILIGLGCAPIFPCMLHETPNRFGSALSQKIMGLQMAFAYIGSTLLPPLLGLATSISDIKIFPFFLIVYIIGMYFSSEKIAHYHKEVIG